MLHVNALNDHYRHYHAVNFGEADAETLPLLDWSIVPSQAHANVILGPLCLPYAPLLVKLVGEVANALGVAVLVHVPEAIGHADLLEYGFVKTPYGYATMA